MPVSVVVTVLNERDSVGRLLESLLRQDRRPAEIIVVDGGSRDGTPDVVRRFIGDSHPNSLPRGEEGNGSGGAGSVTSGDGPRLAQVAVKLPTAGHSPTVAERGLPARDYRLGTTSYRLPATRIRLILQPGSNISQGRNRGIEAAENEIVAVTDAGVRLGRDWLRLITAPLLRGRVAVDVVSGFFVADPHSLFERAMGATVLPGVTEVEPKSFLPSSRSVAFRKSVWRQIGGYPEWLDYCEDIVFDLALRRSLGARFVFEPRAVAYFRPRSNLRSFFRQYYRYARGDGKAGLWPKRHLVRYASYLFLLAATRAVAGARSSPGQVPKARVMALATLLGSAAYLRRPAARLLDQSGGLSLLQLAAMLALLPVIRFTGDLAKMIGYPVGCWWRLRRKTS